MLSTMAEAFGVELDEDVIAEHDARLNARSDELRKVFRESNTTLAVKDGDDVFVNVQWLNMVVQEVALKGMMGETVDAISIAEILAFTSTAAHAEVDSAV